ncbi:putative TRP2-anthranilate synthase component I, partial [Fusarium austroafricanum]
MIAGITTETIPTQSDIARSIQTVIEFVAANEGLEYFAYERNQLWHVGLGCQASLTIDPAGNLATIKKGEYQQQKPILSTIDREARDFLREHSDIGFKIFGYVGYNYAPHARGTPYTPGKWPLFTLMIPRHQITVGAESITVEGRDDKMFCSISNALRLAQASPIPRMIMSVDISQGATEYI